MSERPTAVRRLGRDLTRFGQLSWSERWLLAKTVALMPLLAMGLRVLGFQRLRSLLARLTPERARRQPGIEPIEAAQRVARVVEIGARRGPVDGTCLKRSLALWWLLGRRGIESDLRIGVRSKEETLEAHAWVERGGIVLNDDPRIADRFAPFDGPLL